MNDANGGGERFRAGTRVTCITNRREGHIVDSSQQGRVLVYFSDGEPGYEWFEPSSLEFLDPLPERSEGFEDSASSHVLRRAEAFLLDLHSRIETTDDPQERRDLSNQLTGACEFAMALYAQPPDTP